LSLPTRAQSFEPEALARLAENFTDPRVGAVSGELMFTTGDPTEVAAGGEDASADGVAAQVGLYWKYEKWMRRNEAAVGSMLGATGAIYAIRRVLYQPLPPGTLLDDFLTPMRIVLTGRRAIFEPRARAWDRPAFRAGQEFRRKVRTLAGNYQAFAIAPGLLLPWVNQTTWWQVWSHKMFRLWVPFALVIMSLSSLTLAISDMMAPPSPRIVLAHSANSSILAVWNGLLGLAPGTCRPTPAAQNRQPGLYFHCA